MTAVADNKECQLPVVEAYSLALGARAGATLAIGDQIWGPEPSTRIPIWFTTLASACAVKATSTPTVTISPRAAPATGLTTTTISTVVTYTGIACLSTGLVNCPASLQTTSKYSTKQTLVTSVPSGVKATFPVTTQNAVAKTVAFGKNAQAMSTTTGMPVSFVPPPPSSTHGPGITGFVDGKTGGVSNKVILGVSIGVGVPVLMAIVAGIL